MYTAVRSKNAIGPTALFLLITLTLSGMSGWWGTPSLDGTLCKSLSGSWSVKEKICYINGNGNSVSDFFIASGTTLFINGANFTNSHTITSNGLINNNGGNFNNKGTISGAGSINNNGNFYNIGSINVTGSISNYGSFYNTKTIYNFGRINNYKYWEGCITYNKGSLSGGLNGC